MDIPTGHEDEYEINKRWLHVFAARLGFVTVFEVGSKNVFHKLHSVKNLPKTLKNVFHLSHSVANLSKTLTFLFQHFILVLNIVLAYAIPDMPNNLKTQLFR